MTNENLLAPPVTAYTCPGEIQPISRSLHLARLAAGHAGCQTCAHRQETGLLPRHIVQRTNSRINRSSTPLISTAGIRGLYVNQLTRERMAEIVQHVLEILDCTRMSEAANSVRGGLRIVTGYDARPHSPDLAVGMVSTMKTWGCEIADLGLVSRPAFDYALERFRPYAGLYLTGGNHSNAWNGLDVIDHHGLPWSLPGQLSLLQETLGQASNRMSRSQGRYETVNITMDYETVLAQQFHAIRPLRLAVICPDSLVRNTLKQQLDQTPCSVHYLNGSTGPSEGNDRGCKSMVDTLCDRRLDVGFLIGQDGRICRVFDEGGHELTVPETLALLAHAHLQGTQTNSVTQPAAETACLIEGTEAEVLTAQRDRRIPIVADAMSRFWFSEEVPACDAIQTLAKVLEVLSLSDRPLSAYRHARPPKHASRL